MVQHDRDVLRQLQSQPESCAAYFKANGTGDFSYLPKEMRLAQAEVYADVIEAAMQRPTHISPASDEQLVAWMGEAYARLGYPAEDITRLAQLDTLDAGEVCRVAIQFTSAMGSLGDTEATQVYRASLQ
jgi:hypothetical protein